tara:strand:+ start:2103 stop:2522 length:420 start_codon:yes stop_codon:yes gene_type:complete
MKVYIYIFCLVFFLISNVFGKTNYFEEGKVLFDQKKYLKSKFKFEKDIVFNPKSELSYLFLAKIFNEEKKYDLEEQNLNTVILLNPKNEEAIFLLTLAKIRQSDYSESERLIKNFKKVCVNLCKKEIELANKLINLQSQ